MTAVQDTTNKKNLFLLVQLRWLAVGGQVMTMLVVHFGLGVNLPLIPMAAVLMFLITFNVISMYRRHRNENVNNEELFVELLLDVTALTMQLYLTGGATNPFVSLYLLQVILGAVLLEAWSTWLLLLITSTCFVALTVFYRPLALPHEHGASTFNLHVQGMFACFVLVAILLIFFVTRINRNLRARDAHLANLHQQLVEEEHIVRMGLLASGAAHELGTPLSTLSVILNDWQHMSDLIDNPDRAQDIVEMRAQLARCKDIVSGILMCSGQVRGEGTIRTTVGTFFDGVIADWRSVRSPTRLDYINAFTPDELIVSDEALKQVLGSVLDNAFEASPSWVGVAIGREGDCVGMLVRDIGPGFEQDVLSDIGKPYRSTKAAPGRGLGLFLVINVVRKLGGTVSARNREGGGAEVKLLIPLTALAAGRQDTA